MVDRVLNTSLGDDFVLLLIFLVCYELLDQVVKFDKTVALIYKPLNSLESYRNGK